MNTHDGLLDAGQQYNDASPLSNQSSMASYLRSGHGGPGFSVLAAEVQEQVLAHVLAMPPKEQTDYLARMKQMDAEELVASVRPPQVCDSMQLNRYTVKSGDSLSKIARAQGLRLSTLIEANPQVKNPDLIFPGQVINVPTSQDDDRAAT